MGRGNSFMGMGIAGFRRFLPELRNTKFHGGASRQVSRAFVVAPGKQQSSQGRKAFRICRKFAGRLFTPSVTASSFNPQFMTVLGHSEPAFTLERDPLAVREFYSK